MNGSGKAATRGAPEERRTAMRILAAEFKEREAARRALEHLDQELGVRADASGMRPFVHIDPATLPATTIVAARVPKERAPMTRDLLRNDGGRIIADVDAARTADAGVIRIADAGAAASEEDGERRLSTA